MTERDEEVNRAAELNEKDKNLLVNEYQRVNHIIH